MDDGGGADSASVGRRMQGVADKVVALKSINFREAAATAVVQGGKSLVHCYGRLDFNEWARRF
jgi:hypothetical protein